MGQEIPDINYSKEEHQLWTQIYAKLAHLHKKAMSQRFLRHSEELNKELHLEKRIPQLRELSSYLHSRTGFRIKPTHGILSQREFLNAFAFKLFCSTQYLRNVKNPDYTPEPDIVHEIVGHVPMFADPDIAVIYSLFRKFRIRSDCFPSELLMKKSQSWVLFTGTRFNSESASRETRLWATELA